MSSNIIGKNYAAQRVALLDETTRRPVALGDERTTGNGARVIVTGATPPHKASSTGRVYVRAVGETAEAGYFPGVVGAVWVVIANDEAAT